MTVYFLRDERDLVKIGTTERDVQARLREVALGVSGSLKVDFTIPGGHDVERAVHAIFRRFRVRGEWFQDPPLDPSLHKCPLAGAWDRFLEWGRPGYHVAEYADDGTWEDFQTRGREVCGGDAYQKLFDHSSRWSRGAEDVHVFQPYIGCFQNGGLAEAAAVAKSLGMEVFVSHALSWWNPCTDGSLSGSTVLTAYAKPGVLHDFLVGL